MAELLSEQQAASLTDREAVQHSLREARQLHARVADMERYILKNVEVTTVFDRID